MIPGILSCLIGIWLMAAPAMLGYHGPARINDQTCGPLIASLAIISLWEVTRGLRWLTVALGFWLMLAPLVLHYGTWTSAVNNLACSLMLVICAVIPGRKTHRFEGGWPSLFT
jgi:hypothetical protein